MADRSRCKAEIGKSKVSSRLVAVGGIARLNVGSRGHLSFKDEKVKRPLHLHYWTLKTLPFWSSFESESSRPRSAAVPDPLQYVDVSKAEIDVQ